MQFPILPTPQISPLVTTPPAREKGPALSGFADVLAALRGAPAVSKTGAGGSAAAVRDPGGSRDPVADERDPVADEDTAIPVATGSEAPAAPVLVDQPSPKPEDAADQSLTLREAQVPRLSLPGVAPGPSDRPDEPVDPGGGDAPAPAVAPGPVAVPERSLSATLSMAPAAKRPQADPAVAIRTPVHHPPVLLPWALADVAPPVVEKDSGPPPMQSTPPTPPMPPAPAAVQPITADRTVAPPLPVLPAEPPPVDGEVASPRPETPFVTGPVPSEGPRAILSAPPATSVTPQAVSAQIAVALGRSVDGTIDIALHPRELGRLRLSLTPTDAGLIVTIAAERPETLDLMRRHAAELGQDLRNLGFRDIDLNFGAPGSDQSPGRPLPDPGEDVIFALSAQPAQVLSPSPAPPIPHVVGGLDIRL